MIRDTEDYDATIELKIMADDELQWLLEDGCSTDDVRVTETKSRVFQLLREIAEYDERMQLRFDGVQT